MVNGDLVASIYLSIYLDRLVTSWKQSIHECVLYVCMDHGCVFVDYSVLAKQTHTVLELLGVFIGRGITGHTSILWSDQIRHMVMRGEGGNKRCPL